MKLKSIITISGRICSGKTYLTDILKNEFGIPVASFGSYIKYYCEQNNLSTDRKNLQDIGEKFIKTNADKFLKDVVSHFIKDSKNLILEGVRHKSVFECINQLTEKRISIFIEAKQEIRYQRYLKRAKDSDTIKTFEQFVLFDNHTVELEIESLKTYCDIVIDSTLDYKPKLLSLINEMY